MMQSVFEQVCRRGFIFPHSGSGMVFTHGKMDLSVNPDDGGVKRFVSLRDFGNAPFLLTSCICSGE